MKVLIAYTSKHGATAEIARAIEQELGLHFSQTHLSDVASVDNIADYDAVVLGSAVYAGSWMRPAYQFAKQHADALSALPLWTFSSGPMGEPKPDSRAEPIGPSIKELMKQLQPIGHKVFDGKLDKSKLNFAEKGIIRVVKAPYGDYRDFDEVEKWAKSIVSYLKKSD